METMRPKTGTASDGHHKATTRQRRTPHPPAAREKKKGGEGGDKPHSRRLPHTSMPQAAPPEGDAKRTRRTQRPHAPASKPGKIREADKTKPTHEHTTPLGMAG